MSVMLQQFHFLQPWWLLALIPLPLLCWLGTRRDQGQRELARLVDAALLPLLMRGTASRQRLSLMLFAMGWSLATVALAGPSWSRVSQPLYASRAAQVVALSLSQHMLARDVAPSRLDRARYKVHDLLASNQDGLNALIGYAGEAFVVAPLTSDASSLGDLLDAMAPDTMPVDGNNAARAIDRGVALINDAKAGRGSLVVITDQSDAAAESAARTALAAGVKVSVLGVGTPQGGPVPLSDGGFLQDEQGATTLARRDDAALAALAAAGGGRYVAMTADHRDIDALHEQLTATHATVAKGQLGDEWQDRGPWFLLPLLLIVALAFRRGWLMLLPLVLLPMLPGNAEATTWQDLWQRPDQQAAQALQHGQAAQAQALARDPAWRGAAAYRAGDFSAAAQALQQAAGADAAYNMGNALAKNGNYPQAIAAYDRALKIDVAHADAKANRQAVKDWMDQKKQQKPDEKKQEGQDGSKQPSPGSGQGKDSKPDASKGEGEQGSEKAPESAKPQAGSTTPEQPGKNADGKNSSSGNPADTKTSDNAPGTPNAQQHAAEKAKAEQAQQALKAQMDEALAKPSSPADKPPSHQLGATGKDDPASKLPADLQHALLRVPDDPGALLRRKFDLEYRQRHGETLDDEAQP